LQLDEGAINRRVLIVDDNLGVHEDFRRILGHSSAEGWTTPPAPNGADARLLDQATPARRRVQFELEGATQGEAGWLQAREAREKGEPFALAFVDLRMPPGWDGIQTIERIWQDDPDIQIAICTAYSDPSWHETLDRQGWVDQVLLLKKPFDPIEARQIACSLTYKWSLAALASLVAPEINAAG
jgi:CheY-like chemotaxis protein